LVKKSNRSNCFADRKRNSIILLFLSFLFSNVLLAQNPEPVYRRYTVDDGLPSSMVYHTYQDSKGYMWFATGNGVSRYNGYKFENFDLQSGLVDNEVFEIFEDYKKRIWFIPMSGRLCYFEDGRIISYKYNDKIKELIPTSRGPLKCAFYVDSLDYVYLSIRQYGIISISPEGILKKFDDVKGEVDINAKELPSGKMLISCPNGPESNTIEILGKKNSLITSLEEMGLYGGKIHHHLFILTASDSSFIFSFFDRAYKAKKGRIIDERLFFPEIIWMSIDDENNLWVSPIIGGVQCFENCDITKEPKRILLNNIQVSSIFKDREGAYWFTTLNDGVFYCANLNFLNYTKENGLVDSRVSAITVDDKGVYAGYKLGFVDHITKKSIRHYNASEFLIIKSTVHTLTRDSIDGRIWVSAIDNLYWIKNNEVKRIAIPQNFTEIHPRKLIRSRSGGYWVATTRGLVKCDENKVLYESFINNEFAGVIYDIIEDYTGTVWFSTLNGLWKYSNGAYTHIGDSIPLLSNTSNSLIQNPIDSSLWIGTNGSGIIVKGSDRIHQITKQDGLISNSINQLFYTKNNVWVATKQGLSRIILKDGLRIIKNYTKSNGLPTNEVYTVYEYDNQIYVGTLKGLTVFNKENIVESNTPPKVVISSFSVNNSQIDLSSTKIDLSYDQNSLNIGFVGFVYRNDGAVNYKYRMLGSDTTWVYTQTPNCLYNGLSNGHYVFEVKTQSYNGVWSSKPASISFTIHPPFWKRIWFLVLGSMVFTSLFFLIYKLRINEINRRNSLLQNINLYKQQSLRQQMNPHFIFNTLNSIQLYILEKDPISSHKYLTKFARLMRMTLDNSLSHTIPLHDEIEALKLYLDLEKLRLEDRFEYSIDFDRSSSILTYKIPTLLIQPYVENAIWHGLSLKKDLLGSLRIRLIDDETTITCIIEDNGVGRKKAEEVRQMRNKDHKSRGSQITQQRIDLLSLMYKEKFSVYYDDLFDNQGESLGTRVSIIIPKGIKVNIHT